MRMAWYEAKICQKVLRQMLKTAHCLHPHSPPLFSTLQNLQFPPWPCPSVPLQTPPSLHPNPDSSLHWLRWLCLQLCHTHHLELSPPRYTYVMSSPWTSTNPPSKRIFSEWLSTYNPPFTLFVVILFSRWVGVFKNGTKCKSQLLLVALPFPLLLCQVYIFVFMFCDYKPLFLNNLKTGL